MEYQEERWMYEILNSILYHIEAYLEFCFADRVYRFLLLLLLIMMVVLYVEINGLIYQRKRDKM